MYIVAGAKDSGDNSRINADTTNYLPPDKAWLDVVASYLTALSERTGRQPSWFFWAWNANSGLHCWSYCGTCSPPASGRSRRMCAVVAAAADGKSIMPTPVAGVPPLCNNAKA